MTVQTVFLKILQKFYEMYDVMKKIFYFLLVLHFFTSFHFSIVFLNP